MLNQHKEALGVWINALRSGQFPQYRAGINNSREKGYASPTAFCCLGVAGEALGKRMGDTMEAQDFVQVTCGLSERQARDCVTMNDMERLSFAQIADKLEEWKDA
jgi:hypothetical protein